MHCLNYLFVAAREKKPFLERMTDTIWIHVMNIFGSKWIFLAMLHVHRDISIVLHMSRCCMGDIDCFGCVTTGWTKTYQTKGWNSTRCRLRNPSILYAFIAIVSCKLVTLMLSQHQLSPCRIMNAPHELTDNPVISYTCQAIVTESPLSFQPVVTLSTWSLGSSESDTKSLDKTPRGCLWKDCYMICLE